MSKILILGVHNEIVSCTDVIKYVKVDNDKYVECKEIEALGILDVAGNCIYPVEFRTETVDIIPGEIELNSKFCFESAKGFYRNPNYKEPPKSIEILSEVYDTLTEHQAEVELDVDFRLCMLELGLV